MAILLLFAFLGGLVTILSPCILPILPIVLSGSLVGGHRRPLGIVTGFVLSFTFFTLTLSTIVKLTGVPSESLRLLAVVMVFCFGVFLVLPAAQAWLERIFSTFSHLMPSAQQRDGFWGGVIIGLSLGLVWAPCVGPILASVITLAITSQVNAAAIFITLAYSLGTAVPMLAITYGGRSLLQKVPWLLTNTATIQKGFGVVMMVMALVLFFEVDRKFQTYILQVFPQYGAGLTALEDNQVVRQALDSLGEAEMVTPGKGEPMDISQTGQAGTATRLMPARQPANGFEGGGTWLNSEPLSLATDLRGKVVLVDFWTYSCINCIRTFPYINDWYSKYKDKGLVVVGVHSPEFEFEKNTDNVRQAIADFEIQYPVVQDNEFKIWQSYNNRYWPAHYLIDKEGFIRYTHFGEGKYTETENAIRQLLEEEPLSTLEAEPSFRRQTPETYLGYERAHSYLREQDLELDQEKLYQLPGNLPDDGVALEGFWTVTKEYIQAGAGGSRLHLNFLAESVYLVLEGPVGQPGQVTVYLDGSPLPASYVTSDMSDEGVVVVTVPRKYDLLQLGEEYGRHTLTIDVTQGVKAYAFTFGS